jgi:hypothetical protein
MSKNKNSLWLMEGLIEDVQALRGGGGVRLDVGARLVYLQSSTSQQPAAGVPSVKPC